MNKCVVYCTDLCKKQKEILVTSINSYRQFNRDIDIYLLCDKTSSFTDQLSLKFNVKVVNLNIQDYFKSNEIINCGRFTRFAFCRLLIPLLDIFKQYDKVLYLDTDTVVRKNPDGIFDIDFNKEILLFDSKTHLSFYSNMLKRINNIKKQFSSKWCFNKNNIDNFKGIYNSGVIVFNIKKFNNFEYLNRLNFLNEIYTPRLFVCADQELINIFYDFDLSNELYNERGDGTKYDMIIQHYWGDAHFDEYTSLIKKSHEIIVME